MTEEPTEEPSVEMRMGFEHLARSVDKAMKHLEADRLALREKMNWWRVAVAAALLAAVVGILVGLDGRHTAHQAQAAAHQAQSAIDAANASRAEARITACTNYNDDLVANVNALNERTQALLRTVFTPFTTNPTRTDEQRAEAQAFLDGQIAAYEHVKVPMRDCSPDGIDAWYSDRATTATKEQP